MNQNKDSNSEKKHDKLLPIYNWQEKKEDTKKLPKIKKLKYSKQILIGDAKETPRSSNIFIHDS